MSRNPVLDWLHQSRMARILAKMALLLSLIVLCWVLVGLVAYGLWIVLDTLADLVRLV